MRVRGVLIDLSGTLHVLDKAIPGQVEGLKRLRELKDVKVLFVTNTTKQCRHTLHKEVTNAGFSSIKEEEIFSTGIVARDVLRRESLRPYFLVDQRLQPDFEEIPTSDPNCVVVGLAPDQFEYKKMNQAFRILKASAQPRLIALNKGRYHQTPDGLSLGPGGFVTALEYAADVTAEVIGKPSPAFYQEALTRIGCSVEESVMIGDDVRDDVLGAQRIGLRGILVKTGKYRDGDENCRLPESDDRPHHVAESFAKAVEWIAEQNKN